MTFSNTRSDGTATVASALGISGDTTGMHVKNIYTKLDVHDRTAAVAKAIRRGIIRIQ